MKPERLILALGVILVGLGWPIAMALTSAPPPGAPPRTARAWECEGCGVEERFGAIECRRCGRPLEPVADKPVLRCEPCDETAYLKTTTCDRCYAPLTPGEGY